MKEQTAVLKDFQKRIGYTFSEESLLSQAVRHSSFANEHRNTSVKDNERLEFLGDAVLELCTSEFLYREYPRMPEGEMTKLRASLVCEPTLAMCARQIDLPSCLLLGRGEEMTGGRGRNSVVSDALEAVIGAIYLDGGLEQARSFILRFVLNDIEHKKLFFDSKTYLQEFAQSQLPGDEVRYEILKEEGPAHAKQFVARTWIGEKPCALGKGSTKKSAEQEAAYQTLLDFRKAGFDIGKRN